VVEMGAAAEGQAMVMGEAMVDAGVAEEAVLVVPWADAVADGQVLPPPAQNLTPW